MSGSALTGFIFPRAEGLRLANGLKARLVERHDLPLVHVCLIVLSGNASDPRDLPGMAYATAAMVDEGAGGRSALQIDSAIKQIGSSLTTLVDWESTSFSFQVLRRHLDRGLDLIADVIRRPHLADRDLIRVKDEVRNLALERRASPSRVADLNLRSAVFGRHSYGRPVLPRPDDISAICRRHLVRFHRAHYRPSNAMVVAAGDLSAAELQRKLKERFGTWGGRAPTRPRSGAPPARGPRLVLVDQPGSMESALAVGHLGPRRRSRDYAGIQALNTILGGSFTSRLNQNLREAHGWTYGVSSSFAMTRRGGLFSIHTSVESGSTVDAVAEMFRELQQLVDGGVDEPELDKAKRLLAEELPARAETIRGVTDAHVELAAAGLARDSLERLPGQLERLTPTDVHDLALRVLHPAQATIVVVGELARIAKPLEAAYGLGEYRDLDGRPLRA